jgi:uncharacterized membrane protein
MMWDHGDYWSQGMFGGGWLMVLGLILGTALVVWLVVFLMRQTTHPAGSGSGTTQAPSAPPPVTESPREIFRRRYASGEVDREEYLRRLGDL